jgi:hypothetical protein
MAVGYKDFEPRRRVRELRGMRDREETRAHRAPLFVRVILRSMLVAPLILFVVSVPARYRELHGISDRAQARLGSDDALLAGLLEAYYPPLVLGLEVFFVLALTLSSIAMVSRRSPDWRPMFFSAVFVAYSVWVTQTADALVLPFVWQKVADLIQATGLLLAIHFFLLFPDGRFVPRWTRLNALGWTVYCLAWGLFPAMPLSLKDPFEAPFGAFLILMFLGWTVGLLAQAVRYSRASPLQRTQTKWVLLVIAGACAGYGSVYIPRVFIPQGTELRLLYDLFNVPVFWLLALPIPFALGYAMQRYHLFDVRLIIRKTLAYALLSGTLALVYVGSVVVLQTALRALTGQESELAIIASTLAIAALFRPLGGRIRDAIDRRFYRQKYDAVHTLNEFGSKLRAGTDLDDLSAELVGVVRQTMRPEHVSLWLRPAGFRVPDTGGEQATSERVRKSLKQKLGKSSRAGGRTHSR